MENLPPRSQISRTGALPGMLAGEVKALKENESEVIDLYYWPTPNGHKITMFLEEAGLTHRRIKVDINKGEQFNPDFLKIAPNNRIPAIVDNEPVDGGKPVSVFESGAILLYLAEKTGKLLPKDVRGRAEVAQWLFWQMANLGPMAGQNGHFNNYAIEKIPYAMNRYISETGRLYAILNKRLRDHEFIAGEFSIADIACYPWIVPHQRHRQNLADFPNLKRWFDAIAARPATKKAYEGVAVSYSRPMTDEERKILFGQTAATVGG